MSFIKCFSIAEEIINEATERFGSSFKVNNEKLSIFKEYCEAIDLIAEEFDGTSIEVEVDEITSEISITLESEEIIIESESHILCELLKRTVRYGFSASEDGNLLTKLVFPTLWVKA